MTSWPDWHGPTASSARPAQARRDVHAARGHHEMATRVAAGWRGRRRPAERPGVEELAGIAHTRKGGGAGKGGTDGDAPRRYTTKGRRSRLRTAVFRWRGGGGSGDLWGPRQLQGVNGGVRRGSHWSGVA
jgi:hypothetical protein